MLAMTCCLVEATAGLATLGLPCPRYIGIMVEQAVILQRSSPVKETEPRHLLKGLGSIHDH